MSGSGSILEEEPEEVLIGEVWGLRGGGTSGTRGFCLWHWRVELGRPWEWQVLGCGGHTLG